MEPVKSPGRKTKYSPKLIDELLGYIADGLNVKQSCAAAGIGVTTLREWRAEYPGLEERLEAAREQMRAKLLAQIKVAGKDDWKALAEYLRLSFPELRFGNGANVNVALQTNVSLEERDPERAGLIAKLEEARARALADKSAASAPQPLLEDARDAREIVLEAERNLGAPPKPTPTPERLREHPPRNVAERDALREEREWRKAARRDEVDEILDG